MGILRVLGSVRFTIVLLAATAIACLVGTLMPLARANQFVYRTPWFLGLLGLLSLNLCACTLRRFSSWPRRIGSVTTHLSILLIFAGAIVDGVWGQRGMMQLMVNQTSSGFGDGERQHVLPFAIRLLDFTVERYPPKVSLAVADTSSGAVRQQLALNAGATGKIGSTGWALHVEEVEANLERRVLLSPTTAETGGVGVRVALINEEQTRQEDVLHEAGRAEVLSTDNFLRLVLRVLPDAAARDRALASLQTPEGNGTVELSTGSEGGEPLRLPAEPGQALKMPDGTVVQVLQYVPHFVIDRGAVRSASEAPVNPAVNIRIESPDGTRKETWLFARFPGFHQMHGKTSGVSAAYVRPVENNYVHHVYLLAVRGGDVAYALVSTGSAGVRRGTAAPGANLVLGEGPCRVEIEDVLPRSDLTSGVQPAGPGHGQFGARLQWLRADKPVGEPSWLLLGAEPVVRPEPGLSVSLTGHEAAIKTFRSTVQVLQDGKPVNECAIEVNRPLSFGGYSLYQSSYDRDHEQWTGLEVARSPGVPLVYAGFALFVIGLLFALYVQPYLRRAAAAPREEEP